MLGASWAALLRRIPPEKQDILALVTSVGIEITLQAILRLEEDFAVVRGRLAGTTDAGRVFFVPYDQINYCGFHKFVKEADVHALFAPPMAASAESVAAAPAEAPAPAVEAGAEPAPEPSPEPAVVTPPRPGKAALLERLRSRVKADAAKTPAAT